MKYRLKKDLPDMEAGEIFDDTDSFGHETSSMFDSKGAYRFDKDDIKHFDEWFDPVTDKWPQKDDTFWSISSDGTSFLDSWHNYTDDRRKMAIGNVFKTREAADRFVDYLKAIATVRQDEGVIDLQGIGEKYEADDNKYDDFCVYTVAFNLYLRKLVVTDADEYISANAIWFDTKEYAQSSLDNHPDEWKIILNYDWSRE